MPRSCGFVSLIGKPNVGKSSLVNRLVGEKIALVSHKANATRKRSRNIVMHGDAQIILVDSPGLNARQDRLNLFMLDETLKAISDCDLIVYLADVNDKPSDYERFLRLNEKKIPHILVLTKIDKVTPDALLARLSAYSGFSGFLELIPLSVKKNINIDVLLEKISKNLPQGDFLYDPEILTTSTVREIYKELIREAVFNELSDEIPYESDLVVQSVQETPQKDRVQAVIYVDKGSQKRIVIGKNGDTIKRIGINARKILEKFSKKKIHLDLSVKHSKKWFLNEGIMNEMGY